MWIAHGARLCSQTVDAAFVDAQKVSMAPLTESHIASCIAKRRVKEMNNIWICQHVSPFIFGKGAPVGPSISMRKLRNKITAEQAYDEALEHVDKGSGMREKLTEVRRLER